MAKRTQKEDKLVVFGLAVRVASTTDSRIPLVLEEVIAAIEQMKGNTIQVLVGGEIGQYKVMGYEEGLEFQGQVIPHGSFKFPVVDESEVEVNLPGFSAPVIEQVNGDDAI
jgi:hypothetical protein